MFNQRRCILRTTLTFLAVVIAESVPRFDLVMSLIGGTLTGPLIFIFPPLFYLKILSMENKHLKQVAMETFTSIVYNPDEETTTTIADFNEFKKEKRVLGQKLDIFCCIVIIIFSIACTLITTYVNIKNAITFVNFTHPCIFNVSNSLIDL